MAQNSGVRTSAPEEEGVQGAVGDEVDGGLLCVFEHVLEDARDTPSQLSIFLLTSQVEDDPQTYASHVIPVDKFGIW